MFKRFSGLRDSKNRNPAYPAPSQRTRQPNEVFGLESLEPAMSTLCTPECMAMDDSLEACVALRVLDLIGAGRSGIHVSALIDRIAANEGDGIAATVSIVLEKLYNSHQVAGCGGTFCLPERIADLRQSWLIAGALAQQGTKGDAADQQRELCRQLMHWNGWNMPVYFMLDARPLQ